MNNIYCLEIEFSNIDFSSYYINGELEISTIHYAELCTKPDKIELKIFYDEKSCFDRKLGQWLNTIDFKKFGSYLKIDLAENDTNDHLQKIDLSEQSGNLLSDLNTKKKIDIIFPEEFNQSLINNVFHLEELAKRAEKTARGSVVKLNLEERHFNDNFGYSKNGILQKFFLPIEENIESEFVLIEISASCDYIQNKERLFKYILGVKSFVVEKNKYKSNSDSLFFFPTFYKDREYRLVFNFHFILSLPRNSGLLGEPLIRIKSELLNHFSLNYSQYISRSGIIQF